MRFSRRHWGIAALLGLAACGNADTGLPNIPQAIAAFTKPAPEARIDPATLRASLTPEVLAQAETDLILVEIPTRDAVAVLSLVGTNQGVDTFLTANGIAFSFDEGLLVATRGLGFDLMTADITDTQAALADQSLGSERIHQYLDGENRVITHRFSCRLRFPNPNTAQENCKSANQSFTNSYSFNQTGRMVASSQWISPQLGSIDIEVLN